MALSSADEAFEIWHKFIDTEDEACLEALFAEDIVLRAPVYSKARTDKRVVKVLLQTVIQVFENFEYHRLWRNGKEWALEFSADVNGKKLKGVDLITLDDDFQVKDFEVLIRPTTRGQEFREEMEKRLMANERFLALFEELAAKAG